MHRIKIILLLILSFVFSACSTTSIDGSKSDIKQHINIPINYNLFEQTKIAPLNEQELFYLTQDQQKKVKIDFEKKVARAMNLTKHSIRYLTRTWPILPIMVKHIMPLP
ncbi:MULTISPECIES: hypothetical protein [unclassified Colwellia]|uniref:hypothetical protein n=1 Tax=unclassified Colwellia TaxID=196834 RepID=UPI0015F57A73|nr:MULTISPECIES: hypothetical protein [unclassified Colwellia]MBA6253493.1 hypothetical protein [Colwellia sp. MB3u-55]MBA6397036.1 hypothetical protein [Colwellia sp. BRX10-4]